MILKEAKIYKYKTFEEEQKIQLEEDYTAIVGMNESGKTCLLEAIAKANSYKQKLKFNVIDDYPRKFKKALDKSGQNPAAIELIFKFNDEELEMISTFINYHYTDFEFKYIKNYDNSSKFEIITEIDYIEFLKKTINIEESKLESIINYFKIDYEQYIDGLNTDIDSELIEKLKKFEFRPSEKLNIKDQINEHIISKIINPNFPKILYYDEYAVLPDKVSIDELRNGSSPSIETARALLEVSDIDINKLSLSESKFEEYRSEIEATEAYITEELLKYWSTNNNLAFKFDLSNNGQNYNQIRYNLNVRIYNSRTRMTLPFSARSKGFTWFVSFLVWFKKLQEDNTQNVIILLDEPGLNLHAKAQEDLLKFIRDLAKDYQVIYTTHSPFMIGSDELNKVRTIKFDEVKGSVIMDSIQQKDPNTLFPLQAALGYDIAQNLFISSKNLVVEGIADLVYLNYMSSILKELGREYLDDSITIVPVGGADKVSSFISLLRGNDLKVVCLLDTMSNSTSQKLDNLIVNKLFETKNLCTYESIVSKKYADVEDLFDYSDYINIYNNAMSSSFSLSEIKNIRKGIVDLIERSTNTKFNHYLPAKWLISNPKTNLSDNTLSNFEKVFIKINQLFK